MSHLKNLPKILFFTMLIITLIIICLCIYFIYGHIFRISGQYAITVTNIGGSWYQTKKDLLQLILALIAINFAAYKIEFSSSKANQIDKWVLASSIMVLSIFVVLYILMPYFF